MSDRFQHRYGVYANLAVKDPEKVTTVMTADAEEQMKEETEASFYTVLGLAIKNDNFSHF